ncbi:hypothetical protein E1211_26220 [Micromonospora sp. 15K316]|uniref:hypothetical protein n=1 Tax=Micromonospora sp. 15K316 TaxID=2530376 RepID=UPI00105248B1|nr:hypothetical protein [Micromonospora sp. 15K316]TDC29308.1 hypothetical protein E1211_26220 [Micromonospora sp. 15K316]
MENRSEPAREPLADGGEAEQRRSAAARLFDIRRVIGGLFAVYGVVVTLMGVFDGQAEIDKAQGVRINLWAGLVMLAFGLLMLLWQWLRPAEPPAPEGRERVADRSDDGGPGPATPR